MKESSLVGATLLLGALIGAVSCSGKLNVGDRDTGAADESASGSDGESPSSSGGKSASGSGGKSGSGGSATQSDPFPPVLGPDAKCPSDLPSSNERCELERAACRYSADDGQYQDCLCVEASQGDLRWSCLLGATDPRCPSEPVVHGADCNGYYSLSCHYPYATYCNCAPSDGTWQCYKPWRPDFPPLPTMPDPEKPIAELDDAERSAWCEWLHAANAGLGFPAPEDAPVGPDGKIFPSCHQSNGGLACNASVPQLSFRQCAQNLALSSCSMPISALSDCVATVLKNCSPSPHGCARYLESPGCSGTIASEFGSTNGTAGTTGIGGSANPSDPLSSCNIQVE
jgi:hypothetical protein